MEATPEAIPAKFTFTVNDLGEIPIVAQIDSNAKNKRFDEKDKEIAISIRPGSNKISKYSSLQKATGPILKQKVVIITQDQLKALREGDQKIRVKTKRKQSSQKFIDWKTITVNECPNPNGEFNGPTYTILCPLNKYTPSPFPALEFISQDGSSVPPVAQTDNFLLISPRDPPTPPTPPITAGSTPVRFLNDFKPVIQADNTTYNVPRPEGIPTVAVIDTGLKFNLKNLGQSPNPVPWDGDYRYRDAQYSPKVFNLAYQTSPSPECGKSMSDSYFGCCTLASYQQQPFIDAMNARLRPFPPYNSQLFTGKDVRNSPYDDHVGRHGTVIAAIIQQQASVSILPVKSFDNRGFGTLFDVLSAFNYILKRHEKDQIQVVNASWITHRDEPLLRQKIEELKRAGIFVVAAAGNRNQTEDPNLSLRPLYPACYSQDLPNVITVTSVMEHYLLRPKDRTSKLQRQPAGTFDKKPNHLQDALLNALGSSYSHFELVTDGLDVEANYSDQFVNIGVAGLLGAMPSPFWGGGGIWGSSFAAPFVAAQVAEYLQQNSISLAGISDSNFLSRREEILNAISHTQERLQAENLVEEGRYIVAS